jgi:hypothetical protein
MAEDISGNGRVTLGADKGYDVHDFVGELRHYQLEAASDRFTVRWYLACAAIRSVVIRVWLP